MENFSSLHFVSPQSAMGALTGTVTNNAQQPIMGAIVTVEGTGLTDITNSIGVYHIDDIIQNNYEVSFSHPDYCDTALTGVSIIANQTTTADMTMGGMGFIDGFVTDSGDNPVDSVIVTVEGTDITDTTDSNGAYLLRSLCPGSYSASFSHPDYVELTVSDITVTENDTAHVNVTLWPPVSDELVVWYGPPIGAPIQAIIGERLNIDVYIQTGSDVAVGHVHVALGTEDQYFDSLLSRFEGVFYDVIPQWDYADFLPPDGSPPNPDGWSNQSAFGIWSSGGPPNPPLICPIPTKILTYVVRVPNDSSLIGQTIHCLGPGTNGGLGQTFFGDTLSLYMYNIVENFNPLYFASASDFGTVSGTVTDSAQLAISGVIVTVQGTGISDTTDGMGQYSCENIEPGTYNVSFSHHEYMTVIVGDVIVAGGGVTVVDVTMYASTSGCDYVVGDVNNSGDFNGLDITFGVGFFKGGQNPFYSCECTPGNIWYVVGDLNNSCSYNGLDVTYGVAFLKGGSFPIPCADCPTVSLLHKIVIDKSIDK
jgi:protocatechuate 3,4-dioxygenase beta subunit